MPSLYNKHFEKIIASISLSSFSIPKSQSRSDYFPEFLNSKLVEWIDYYRTNLKVLIDSEIPFDTTKKDVLLSKIKAFAESICETVKLYYAGKVLEASENFNMSLNEILFDDTQTIATIEKNRDFYRGRKNENMHFAKADLFHIPFESRHLVSTNRYSIPGFPALYLGDSIYICWEEYSRFKLRELWFSRLVNTTKLKVIRILRIEDFLVDMNKTNDDLKLTFLLRYLVTFPLIIACTIRVREPNGNFKPEYIIPQLLLQYVSKNPEIDGIMFPSTKIDYARIYEVPAYNYVFPVKTFKKAGYCDILSDKFFITEPTSLEIEEVIYNPRHKPGFFLSGSLPANYIEIVKDEKSYYANTSFRNLEESLIGRTPSKII